MTHHECEPGQDKGAGLYYEAMTYWTPKRWVLVIAVGRENGETEVTFCPWCGEKLPAKGP